MPNAPTPLPADDLATTRRTRLLLLAMAALACAWPAWLVFGLRHTTHDDLALSWVATHPQLSWWEVTDFISRLQRRIQNYVWIPLWMFGATAQEHPLGSALFALQVAGLIGALAWMGWRLAGPRAGVLFAWLLGFGFAMHPFFMSPPGFPIMALATSCALLLAIYALWRSREGARAWRWLSAVAWLIVVMGPEYNLAAFGPLVLIAIILFVRGWADRLRTVLLFATIVVAYAALALAFRKMVGTSEDAARVTASFSSNWWITFWTLLRNGPLLGALLGPVRIDVAAIGGMPVLPGEATLGWLLGMLRRDGTYVAAAGLFWVGFAFLLGGPRIAWPMRLGLLGAALAVALMPPAILSLSATYQVIVPAGWLQGHLATAHVQAGLLGILALLLGGWGWGHGMRALVALPLALWCTGALAYNLSMRDLLAANDQRWDAFALLAEHGNLEGRPVTAPEFWSRTGVSSIPQALMPAQGQYWRDRARSRHGADVQLRGQDEAARPGDLRAGFAVAPDGAPALWIEEAGRIRLLSSRPGAWIARGAEEELRLGTNAWQCEAGLCRATLPGGFARPENGAWLWPAARGPRRLSGRITLQREGAFGTP